MDTVLDPAVHVTQFNWAMVQSIQATFNKAGVTKPGWYWADESFSVYEGPYETQQLAIDKFNQYKAVITNQPTAVNIQT